MSQLRDMRTNIMAREMARRWALWGFGDESKRAETLIELAEIDQLDRDYPIGPAADWTIEELAERVPRTPHPGSQNPKFFKVLDVDIPEPWRSRMAAAGTGSAKFPDAFYGVDWLSFLRMWPREQAALAAYRAEQ